MASPQNKRWVIRGFLLAPGMWIKQLWCLKVLFCGSLNFPPSWGCFPSPCPFSGVVVTIQVRKKIHKGFDQAFSLWLKGSHRNGRVLCLWMPFGQGQDLNLSCWNTCVFCSPVQLEKRLWIIWKSRFALLTHSSGHSGVWFQRKEWLTLANS